MKTMNDKLKIKRDLARNIGIIGMDPKEAFGIFTEASLSSMNLSDIVEGVNNCSLTYFMYCKCGCGIPINDSCTTEPRIIAAPITIAILTPTLLPMPE